MDKETKYIRAKERVAELKEFYTSVLSYVLIISFLAGVNYYVNEWRYAWFLWAAFGWGIGLIFQGIKAFQLNPFLGRDWESRMIKKFMDEDKTRDKWE